MRWRIPLVATLALFVTVSCSEQPNPTAPGEDAAGLAFSVAAIGGVACLLPVAVPDRWFEAGGPGNDPGYFNPEYEDFYDPALTGYSESDIGTQLAYTSSTWYYRWLPPGQNGQKSYVEHISSCVDPSPAYTVGDDISIQKGGLNRQALAAFQDLIASDPDAVWDTSLNCVTDAAEVCRGSTRLRAIPMFDPSRAPEGGDKSFTIIDFAVLFVDRIEGSTLYVRVAGL